MKHFANFAPSYNNIGLGVGAAVGLARGSGLIGESQEERDNTTGLGRLGKLAGYTGGGAALGAGTGMAVNAGTKYLRGRKGNVPEPRPQDRTTSAEPWDDDWNKPTNTKNEGGTTKNIEEKEWHDSVWFKPAPLSKPTGYRGLGKEEAAAKLKERKLLWDSVGYDQYSNNPTYKKLSDRDASGKVIMPLKERTKIIQKLQKDATNKTLEELQPDIQSGYYAKSQTDSRNF